MRLFASTTTSGSIKTVLPLADSSCTIPFIFRLKAGATGIIKRPSRMVGVTSLSTTPSDCAARRMDCRLRDIPLIVIVISLRICDRVEEALSLTLPNLSIGGRQRYLPPIQSRPDTWFPHRPWAWRSVRCHWSFARNVWGRTTPVHPAKYLPAESVSRNSARRRNNWRGIPCLRVGYG